LLRLFDSMRADADDLPRPQELSCFAYGQVVLPDVDAVRIRRQRDVGAVVNDADHLVLATQLDEFLGTTKKFAAFQRFLPQL
jgi:hypothetical protein